MSFSSDKSQVRVLKISLIFSFFYIASALAGETVFENNGVSVTYDKITGIYEVKKNGSLDSKRVIESYDDVAKMTKLLRELGAEIPEELPLTLKNNLMKSLKPPTDKQMTEVGLVNFSSIESIATDPVRLGSSCPLTSTPSSSGLPQIGGSQKKGWFCAAPSDDELKENWDAKEALDEAREKKSFMDRWLGDNVKHSGRLDTYNDNFLHGGGIALTGKQTADDRARTFGDAIEYEMKGDDGSFSFRYSNNLFTRLAPQEGQFGFLTYRDDEDKVYLEAMEETTLSFRGTKNFVDDDRLYGVGTLSFRERTADDRGSQSIQDYWHEISGSVRYNYLDHMEDEYSLEAKAGVGMKVEGDLGKWRCKAQGEVLAGVDLWGMDRAEIEFNGSVGLDSGTSGGRTADNPWIALDAYTRQSIDTDALHESMYGARVSTSFKWGESTIKPYLGIEYYDEESDRMFQTEMEGNELIHTIGVQVSF